LFRGLKTIDNPYILGYYRIKIQHIDKMKCPYCGYDDSKVTDSRHVEQGIRRRRCCLHCGSRFTTYERVENLSLLIIKKDERREEFNRHKLLVGMRKACEKRPLPAGTIEKMADEIESQLHSLGQVEIPSSVVGEMVMEWLKKIDHIAYIRFASVYRAFADIGSLKQEVDILASGSQLPLMPSKD
jgi:transcriptional repressor NrdR